MYTVSGTTFENFKLEVTAGTADLFAFTKVKKSLKKT